MASKKAEPIRIMYSGPTPGEGPKPSWPRYRQIIAAAARPGTTVELTSLRRGYNRSATPYTGAYNALAMVERAYEAEKKGYDAFIIGCASDMGLREARSLVSIPVVAPTESATLLACTLGTKFSIIVLDPKWAPVIENTVRGYGLGERLASVKCPAGLTDAAAFEMMHSKEQDKLARALTAEMSRAVSQDGAEALIVACTSGSAFLTAQGIHQVDGAPVVDVIAAEIKMAEIMVDLKRAYETSVCPASIYYPPPPEWEKDIPITFD
ncbi:aspartate/glutamate racemase family protein [Chloroflexota bacterium]